MRQHWLALILNAVLMRLLRRISPLLRRLVAITVLMVAAASVGVMAYVSLTNAAGDLQLVRERLEEGVDQADTGDVAQAAATFRDAEAAAERALSQVHSPAVRLVGFVPRLDVTVDSVIASTEAAHLIAEAGVRLMAAVADVPGGLDALTLGSTEGQAGWLDAATQLQAPIHDAQARLELALDLVGNAPEQTSSSEVDRARTLLHDELAAVVPALDDVAALVEVLPDLFGADGEVRRYFLGAQNPAETRGTGGLIGAYSILTARDGEVTIRPFRPVQELPQDLFSEDLAPTTEFFAAYDSVITGRGTWLNVNFSPHFPSVAETIEAMYREATGERLDGTIVVDPFALEAMLAATGPVTVPDPDVGTIQADTIVEFITNEAPLLLGTGGERKEILGDAARAVLDAFLSGSVPGRERVEALSQAVQGGHVLMHAASPQVQEALARIDLTGALADAERLVLDVSLNNTAESKADFWLTQSAQWTVALDPDGTGTARLQLTLTNTAPADPSIPRYIIGPGVEELSFGDSRPLVAVACGTCQLIQATYDDVEDFGVREIQEQGHSIYLVQPVIPIGESRVVEFVLELPDAWTRSGSGGIAQINLDTPNLVTEVPATVQVEAPSGWRWDAPEEGDGTASEGLLTLTLTDPSGSFGPYTLSTAP